MPRMIDLTGRRFGRLLVLGKTDRRDGSSVVWHCRCDCGSERDIPARNLLHRGTVSCGCQRRQRSAANLAGAPAGKLGQVDRTNVSRLRSTRPQRNNRAGRRGVSWQPNGHGHGGHWRAVIYFRRRRYSLGLYDTPEDAEKAYLAAKERIHADFVAWYEAQK